MSAVTAVYISFKAIFRRRNFPHGATFSLFKDQLAESGRQKTKENIILRGIFLLAENDPLGYFPLGGIFRAERHFLLFKTNWRTVGVKRQKEILFRAENSV